MIVLIGYMQIAMQFIIFKANEISSIIIITR